jgi:hypothetical protein
VYFLQTAASGSERTVFFDLSFIGLNSIAFGFSTFFGNGELLMLSPPFDAYARQRTLTDSMSMKMIYGRIRRHTPFADTCRRTFELVDY